MPCWVRPMVVAEGSGTPIAIDLAVIEALGPGSARIIVIHGPPGSGRSTALDYLREVLPPDQNRVILPEELEQYRLLDVLHAVRRGGRLICTSAAWLPGDLGRTNLSLTPWEDDQLIEYVLAADKERARAVLPHALGLHDRSRLRGNPQLWSLVLDALLGHEELRGKDLDAILRRALEAMIEPRGLPGVREACWRSSPFTGCLARYTRHEPIRLLLAAQHFVERAGTNAAELLGRHLPASLIAACAAATRDHAPVRSALRSVLRARPTADPSAAQAMAASILHAAGVKWSPSGKQPPVLNDAILPGIRWRGARLRELAARRADLSGADLTDADMTKAQLSCASLAGAALQRAQLTNANLDRAGLSRADLGAARLDSARLDQACFAGANLENALLRDASIQRTNLRGARLVRADLRNSTIAGADLAGADLSGARLDTARLTGLDLRACALHSATFRLCTLNRCDMQELNLRAADFEDAELAECDLTGAFLENANLKRAVLSRCGLADIDLEGADLREADLRGSTFHMGSSRSGLVFSAAALEGSRTGFYTDELEEQEFRAPEDIRKANLRGADLRGAEVEGVDFYLVDLRGAKYSEVQGEWFRRCGAILKLRCG